MAEDLASGKDSQPRLGPGLRKLLDPGYWLRALSNPIVLVGLAVDLLPIYALFRWGWTAVPLVMLYWMENIIAGLATLPRIFIAAARYGGWGFLLGAFLCAFFVVHYGLFCAVHGTFLVAFVSMTQDFKSVDGTPMMDIIGIFRVGLESGRNVDIAIGAIVGFQVLIFLWEFVLKGHWRTANPMVEMYRPYMRIIVLHFGIFAGAAALFLLGQPMIGVLALILFRAVWGVMSNSDRFGAKEFNEAIAKLESSNEFDDLLRGKLRPPPSS